MEELGDGVVGSVRERNRQETFSCDGEGNRLGMARSAMQQRQVAERTNGRRGIEIYEARAKPVRKTKSTVVMQSNARGNDDDCRRKRSGSGQCRRVDFDDQGGRREGDTFARRKKSSWVAQGGEVKW